MSRRPAPLGQHSSPLQVTVRPETKVRVLKLAIKLGLKAAKMTDTLLNEAMDAREAKG